MPATADEFLSQSGTSFIRLLRATFLRLGVVFFAHKSFCKFRKFLSRFFDFAVCNCLGSFLRARYNKADAAGKLKYEGVIRCWCRCSRWRCGTRKERERITML